MNKSRGLIQAYEVQDLAYNAMVQLKGDIEKGLSEVDEHGKVTYPAVAALSQLVKAWDTAQDRIRIHRGKPLPGALKHSERKVKARSPADILSVVQDIEAQQSSQNP